MSVWLSSLTDVGLRPQGMSVCSPKGCGSPSPQDVDFSSHVPFLACMQMLRFVQMLASMQDGTCMLSEGSSLHCFWPYKHYFFWMTEQFLSLKIKNGQNLVHLTVISLSNCFCAVAF